MSSVARAATYRLCKASSSLNGQGGPFLLLTLLTQVVVYKEGSISVRFRSASLKSSALIGMSCSRLERASRTMA